MKKRVMILAGIVVIVMSGLSNIALSLTEDPQWTPYVLRWDEKLPVAKKKPVKKVAPMTICGPRASNNLVSIQR